MEHKRSSFTGKLGFVLAAAGSAVGLGNIWRFPYLAAKYGGGMFLLVYIILSLTFGFSLMIAEIAIGRKTGLSPIGAYEKLNKKFSFVGYLASIAPMLILPYYSVIGGWVIKYFGVFLTGQGAAAANDGYFDSFVATTWEPIGYFALFIGVTALVVLLGVEKGIEKVSKILMPVLVGLSVVVAVYSCFIPGAGAGIAYYLVPNFENFSIMTVVAAMGQLFYSMSIAMGIMITYGSYMKKDVNIESSVHQIEMFDTGIAFLAGLMIIPAVFAFSGGDPMALNKGEGLMFVTLPKVFESMWGGQVIGAVFFLLVLLAALTSSISLMETVVSVLHDKLRWSRKICCLVVLVGAVLLGLPSTLGYGVLENVKIIGMNFLNFFDFVTNSLLMPFTALISAIFVGFILKPKALVEEIELSGKFRFKGLFTVMIKYIAPICLVIILISSVLDVLGIVKI